MFYQRRVNIEGRGGEIDLCEEKADDSWKEGIDQWRLQNPDGSTISAELYLERKLVKDRTKPIKINVFRHDDPPQKCYCNVSDKSL